MKSMTKKMAQDAGIILSRKSHDDKPRARDDGIMFGERFYRIESIEPLEGT